jgi:ferredoxin
MEILIDGIMCTGCGLCVDELPEVFAMDDEGLAYVKYINPNGALADRVRETAAVCPVGVIRIEG